MYLYKHGDKKDIVDKYNIRIRNVKVLAGIVLDLEEYAYSDRDSNHLTGCREHGIVLTGVRDKLYGVLVIFDAGHDSSPPPRSPVLYDSVSSAAVSANAAF